MFYCFIFFNNVKVGCIPHRDVPSAEGRIEALHTSFTADHLNALVIIVMIAAML